MRPLTVNDEVSVVPENKNDYGSDDDVREDALEQPEEFFLAKPQELDVEDELEGDFKCVAVVYLVGSQITDANALQPVL